MAGASAISGLYSRRDVRGLSQRPVRSQETLFLCALLYAVSGVLSAMPRTFGEFLAARFISGLGIGASSMICPVYIAEISPEKWRGRLGSLFQLGIVTGIFLTLFVNKVIQGLGDDAWNASVGWRWMLGLEVVPAIVFILLLFTVPESPRWLTSHGREEEARGILTRIGGPEHAERELAAIRAAMSHEEGRFSELLTGALSPAAAHCGRLDGLFAILRHQRHHLLLDQDFPVGGRSAERGLHLDRVGGAGEPGLHVCGHCVC